jgi:hypothetical protein
MFGKIFSMKRLRMVGLVLGLSLVQGCVPKTQYDDQTSKLIEAQNKLRSMQASNVECDRDLFIQLKEQAQSLDLLTQELVERNTELSKEVARLKVIESQSKADGQNCDRKLSEQVSESEGKLERTRTTYEDLLKELKAEISRLKETADKRTEGSKSKGKTKPLVTPKVTPKEPAPTKPTESPKAKPAPKK